MNQQVGRQFALSLAVALAFSACVTQRQVPFHEADFKWAAGKGSGTVNGQLVAGLTYVGWTGSHPETLVGHDEDIALLPANAYTEESIQRKYIKGEKLADGDPHEAQYLRDGQTDDQGHFAFRDIPPGNYFVGAEVRWKTHYYHADDDNNLLKWTVWHTCMVYARVAVKNGQISTVTEWNEGKEKRTESQSD